MGCPSKEDLRSARRDIPAQKSKCPDGGACHHGCINTHCARRDDLRCEPLSESGLDIDWKPFTIEGLRVASNKLRPVISPFITNAASKLVLEALPITRVEQWRWKQLATESCNILGLANSLRPRFEAALRDALTQRSGKHEYEVWAVEDVFLKFWREQEAAL